MATITDNELVQAVKDRLESALPAQLAAAGLPPVTEFLDYDPALPQPADAPQIWIDLARSQPSADPSRGATVHKYSVRPELMVGVTAAGEDPSEAMRQLRELVQFIRQTLEADQTLGGRVLWCRWSDTAYSPNLSTTIGSLFKAAILTFDLNYRTRIGAE